MAAQVVLSGVLGKGAYGTVYRGKWRGLDVAVKTGVSTRPAVFDAAA
jgi:predicted Ser/Thr protein kinase